MEKLLSLSYQSEIIFSSNKKSVQAWIDCYLFIKRYIQNSENMSISTPLLNKIGACFLVVSNIGSVQCRQITAEAKMICDQENILVTPPINIIENYKNKVEQSVTHLSEYKQVVDYILKNFSEK